MTQYCKNCGHARALHYVERVPRRLREMRLPGPNCCMQFVEGQEIVSQIGSQFVAICGCQRFEPGGEQAPFTIRRPEFYERPWVVGYGTEGWRFSG